MSRSVAVGLSAFSLLLLGFTFTAGNASAAGDLPATINDVVSVNGTLTDPGCPASLSAVTPTPTAFTNLVGAVAAAPSGGTIYVCAGAYLMSASAYGSGENVLISKAITVDGYNWDEAPSPADTPSSYDPTTQSVFEQGSGLLVESPNVTISGLTFYENNFNDPNNPVAANCNDSACETSITVMTFVNGAGDQGESNVTISDNFFDNVGGLGPNGVVHFGLGQDGDDTDVAALDSNDVVQDNVFTYAFGFENNAVQMSDTTGAVVSDNTVNYPTNDSSGQDDGAMSALWFPGFDQALTVSDNTLSGGGIDNDSGASIDTQDPKSGIKIIDEDLNGTYGSGCSEQNVTGNTVAGFVYDIAIIGNDVNDDPTLCSAGPTDFSVTSNTVSDATLDGIYVSADATDGTLGNNVASDSDTAGTAGAVGEYDYYDAAGTGTTNAWTNNTGNGSSYPSSIETPSSPSSGSGSGSGSSPTTTTTTSTTTTTTTTTTLPPPLSKPSVTIVATALAPGNKVAATALCSGATCSGTLELTRVIGGKVKILGTISYHLAKGTQHQYVIQLNATGVALLRANSPHHVICELTVSGAGGVWHKNISI
jgi:hypothetical protein